MRLCLPTQTFFEPTMPFIKWFCRRYDSRRVVEAGSGVGLFALLLQGHGVEVQPLEICERDSFLLQPTFADATTYQYHEKDLVVVCRPSHGNFCDDLFTHCLSACKMKEVVYVGLEENFELDIDTERFQYEVLYGNAGSDNEVALSVTLRT